MDAGTLSLSSPPGRRETMERNYTKDIPFAPRGICIKNKNIGNSLGGSLLQSLAFLFFMLFLSLSLFTGNFAYASNLTGPGVKSLSSQKELRAVWFSYLDWINMPKEEQAFRAEAAKVMDNLQKNGFQTIFLHVHSHSDSYGKKMTVFPYSKFMPGNGSFDPLEIMISEAKKKGISVHAWFNPYRVSSSMSKWENIPEDSIVKKWSRTSGEERNVLLHEGQYYINPSRAAGREALLASIKELLDNYAVDGIHFDDYFYPYPAAGFTIDDDREFRQNNNGITNKGDWRRDNVNIFIKQLSDSIHSAKPWVKFGISPFGIYRNKKSAPQIGSDTNGLQNYDDLYADVLLWVNNGWVDYCVPQLYWQIGNKAADYETLIKWWNKYASNRPLYIGEDIERTVKYQDIQNPSQNQMPAKYALQNRMENVQGVVLWYAKTAVDNIGNYGTNLRTNYWRYPSLQPRMPFIDDKAPKKPKRLKKVWTEDGYMLFWKAPKGKHWDDVAHKYVVYKFDHDEEVNINDASKIVEITSKTYTKLPYDDGTKKMKYVVTALDRMSNESKIAKKKVKL